MASLPSHAMGLAALLLGKFDSYNSMDTRGGGGHKQALCAYIKRQNVRSHSSVVVHGKRVRVFTRSAHSAQRGAELGRRGEGTSCFICCRETVLQFNYLSWLKTTADTCHLIPRSRTDFDV